MIYSLIRDKRGLYSVEQYRPRIIVHFCSRFELRIRPVQRDVIDVHCACPSGCGAAFAAQADGELIHVSQIDALIGEGL